MPEVRNQGDSLSENQELSGRRPPPASQPIHVYPPGVQMPPEPVDGDPFTSPVTAPFGIEPLTQFGAPSAVDASGTSSPPDAQVGRDVLSGYAFGAETMPEVSQTPTIHVYPKGVVPRELTGDSSQNSRVASTPLSAGHHGQSTGPAVHVYPDGAQLRDLPPAERISTTAVSAQQLFAPPPNVSAIRSMPADGGHSGIAIPDPTTVAPDMMEPALAMENETTPQRTLNVESDAQLSWWEADLTQNVLRGREAFPMTLQQALGFALTEAPELQVLRSDWYIQQTEFDRLDAAFDWTTFVNTIWNRDSTPVGSDLEGATSRLRTRTLSSVGGLRRLSRNGSEVEISQTMGMRSSNSRFINPNNQGTSRLALSYDRPLLRGAGEDYNTSRVQLAEIDKDIAFDRFQIGVQDHLLEVASAYWTLVLRRGRFVQSVKSWKWATEISEEMAQRVEVDVTPNMLDRTRAEVASRLALAIETEHDALLAQDGLLRLIYGSRYPEFADKEVITLTLPMKQGEPVAPESQIQAALFSRSEVHQSIREIKSASVRYNVAANEVLPVLDMVLTSYVAGLRGNNDVGGAFVNQFNQGEPGVGIGFNFEIPYRNRAAQAAAEQGFIAIKRMKASLEATIGQVTEDVREQVIQRNKYGSVLQQQWESLARAKRILKYTQIRREVLADGVEVADLYLENLLLMQNRLVNAEFAYLDSQVRFSLADNSLLRAISKLDSIADVQDEQISPVIGGATPKE